MVIQDISEKKSGRNIYSKVLHIDRLFAAVIDFLILSPVIGLFTSGIVNEIKLNSLYKEQNESLFLISQYLFISFSLFVLYETTFNYFLKATPGHYFLYQRLESENSHPLSLTRILFRAVFKFWSYIFLLLPFIEILVSDERKTFYDRISCSRLVSLKTNRGEDEVALPMKYWLQQSAQSVVAMVFILIGLLFYQTVGQDTKATNHQLTKELCDQDLQSYLVDYIQDLDVKKNKDCIIEIVDHRFDKMSSQTDDIDSMNYFSKFLLSEDKKLKAAYLNKFCQENSGNILCIKFEELSVSKLNDDNFVYGLYALSKFQEENNYLGVFLILDQYYEKLAWNDRLERLYMFSYLKIQDINQRGPASIRNQLKVSFSNFRKRVGLVK